MTPDWSEAQVAAFHQWRTKGYASLSDAQLKALDAAGVKTAGPPALPMKYLTEEDFKTWNSSVIEFCLSGEGWKPDGPLGRFFETSAASVVRFADLLPLIQLLQAASKNSRERQRRIEALEAQVAQLKSEPRGLLYAGVWQRAATYTRHQGVTHQGHTWACVVDSTRAEPTTDANGNRDWQLAVRAGRDAR